MAITDSSELRSHLAKGQVIPAMPLPLDENREWSKRHQRALVRYYLDAGAGGLAVGVHSTQFEIRDPEHALFEPVLKFCSRAIDAWLAPGRNFVKIAGICGTAEQAGREARFATEQGYHAGLLSLVAMGDADDTALIEHCRSISQIIPLIGFYLQPMIGGRTYGYSFWRAFAEIKNVVAIKIAPFDRYATLDVVRAVADSGRKDIALYTGNDDNVVHDLVTPFPFGEGIHIAGGLLGQWAVGTHKAAALLRKVKIGGGSASEWAALNASLTDFNSAIFDPAHRFAGCLSGINEILRRDGLLPTHLCLESSETLSPGQLEELDRVSHAYPEWQDTEFIRENLDRWLEP